MTALEELVQAGGTLSRYFTSAEVEEAKAYIHPLIVRHYVHLAVEFLKFGLIFGLAINRRLLRLCERATAALAAKVGAAGTLARLSAVMDKVWKGPGWGAAVLFVLAYQLLNLAIGLPDELYFDWYRPLLAGLTSQGLPSYLLDLVKGSLAYDVGLLSLVIPLYALMRRFSYWWLVIGAVGVAAMLASGLADPYRQTLLYETHPLEAGPVRAEVERVLAAGKVSFKDVLVINGSRTSNTADAYFAGQGPTREIVIFDTMISAYTPREIAAAVAHEVGHLQESVITRKVYAALLMVPLLFLFHLALSWGARTGKLGFDSEGDVAGLPLLWLLYFMITLAAGPYSNTSQRQRETDADAVSLELTHDPEAFISLMVKLTKQNKVDPVPEALVETWLSSHPAVARRVAMALRFEAAHPDSVKP